MNRTQRACKHCGKSFYGNPDCLLCPDCAKKAQVSNVVRSRVCKDCGVTFQGGPRATRCPECRLEAAKESTKRYRKKGAMRPLGSFDVCPICGQQYTVVSGRQKYCSETCQRVAVLEWQKNHKREYNKLPETRQAKKERRAKKQKICEYCLRRFWTNTATNVCSDYCKGQHKRIRQCEADIKRGYNRNIQKYYDEREAYRMKIRDLDEMKGV